MNTTEAATEGKMNLPKHVHSHSLHKKNFSRLLFKNSQSSQKIPSIRKPKQNNERACKLIVIPDFFKTSNSGRKCIQDRIHMCTYRRKEEILLEKDKQKRRRLKRRSFIPKNQSIVPKLRIQKTSFSDFLQEFKEKAELFSDSWREALKELKN